MFWKRKREIRETMRSYSEAEKKLADAFARKDKAAITQLQKEMADMDEYLRFLA